ncbi:Fic family protein [Microbacteriaceae bacterium VKM Ac-2854]|nr:Fic family protein [Microbacteriaceae bacterium VKM Ac-2854]
MSVDDHYTHPGSGGVLRNLLNLRDGAELDQALNEFATVRWAQLEREPLPERFNLAQLQYLHRRLFEDVYPFAGDLRDVDVQALGAGIAYCRPAFLEEQAAFEFRRLENDGYLQERNAQDFAAGLADHWGEITALHPFRDGNTRSQSAFVTQLAARAGWTLQWSAVDVDQLRALRLEAVTRSSAPLAGHLEERIRPVAAASAEELQQLRFLVSSPRAADAATDAPTEARSARDRMRSAGSSLDERRRDGLGRA